MTTDQPATTDLRTAILARCDELERIAKAADDPEDWRARRAVGALALATPDDDMDREWWVGAHVATWDPDAVLALVAGAREMCEVHQPADDPDYHQPGCRGCGLDRTGEWMERIGDCPTLAALARMLGVDR